MATITPTITLTSDAGDLITDALSISTNTSITAPHTTGISRETVTSTAKGTASGQVTLYTADDLSLIHI